MNQAELERELALRGPRRAYLLAGAESLLRDDALAVLRRAVIGDGDPAFLLDRFDASAAPGELSDALHTLPVIAARRLVVLSRAGGAPRLGARAARRGGRLGRERAATKPRRCSSSRRVNRTGARAG